VASLDGHPVVTRPILHDVGPEQRLLVSFDLRAPQTLGRHKLALALRQMSAGGELGPGTLLVERDINVVACAGPRT
jgi:hypothetical protein